MDVYLLLGGLALRNFLLTFFALSGIILYYIPVSRSYFCKGCYIFIDTMAYSLKHAVNTLDNNKNDKTKHKKKSSTLSSSSPHASSNNKSQENLRYLNSEKYRKSHNHHHRYYHHHNTKDGMVHKDTKKRNREWQEPYIYTDRDGGLELQRESYSDFRWSKGMSDRPNDDVLYLDNDTLNEGYDCDRVPSSVEDINNAIAGNNTVEFKLNNNKIVEEKNDSKKKRQSKSISYTDYLADDEINIKNINNDSSNVYKEKLLKLHKKIRSLVSMTDTNLKQHQQLEALKIIEDLLKNAEIKSVDNKMEKKNKTSRTDNSNSKRNKNKFVRMKMADVDDDIIENDTEDEKYYAVGSADNSWTRRHNHKSRESTKREFESRNSQSNKKLSTVGNGDIADELGGFAPPPIIHDRVTPILKNVYGWIFGGCPSSK